MKNAYGYYVITAIYYEYVLCVWGVGTVLRLHAVGITAVMYVRADPAAHENGNGRDTRPPLLERVWGTHSTVRLRLSPCK